MKDGHATLRVSSTRTFLLVAIAVSALGGAHAACSSERGEDSSSSNEALSIATAQSVLTQHNDIGRSGAYLAETQLTPQNVKTTTFGRLYTRAVDGQIAAQPLYVHGVTVNGAAKNVVYVATRKSNVYAFDADNLSTDPAAGVLWTMNYPGASEVDGFDFRVPFLGPDGGVQSDMGRGVCGQTHGPVGITGTPVIDAARNRLYFVARSAPQPAMPKGGALTGDAGWGSNYWLYAVDLATGAEQFAPVKISPTQAQLGDWDPDKQLNRPGLLFTNGILYMAFGGLVCDDGAGNPFNGTRSHGWVMAYDVSGSSPVFRDSFETTPSSVYAGSGPNYTPASEGGIWMSGNGLASDGAGNVFFLTGNNDPRTDRAAVGAGIDVNSLAQYGESFIRLHFNAGAFDKAPWQFRPGDWFRHDTGTRYLTDVARDGDSDLGSGGALLLPATTAHPAGTVIGGGKPGRFYVLDRGVTWLPDSAIANGGANPSEIQPALQAFQNTWHPEIDPYDYDMDQAYGPNIHGSPVFWRTATGGLLYAMPEKDYLRSFAWNPATSQITPALVGPDRSPDGMPGTVLALSANGTAAGILWASVPLQDATYELSPGKLAAYDATTLGKLWEDDDVVAYAKFTSPTVADGKVFRPTFGNQLIVYGLTSANPQPRCLGLADKYNAAGGAASIGVGCVSTTTSTGQSETCTTDARGATPNGIYVKNGGCAHVVLGGIQAKYASLGGPAGTLGYPITDTLRVSSSTIVPDERWQDFENGRIYESNLTIRPQTSGAFPGGALGTHYLSAGILATYLANGAEQGMGLPTSDTVVTPWLGSLTRQDSTFERGTISVGAPFGSAGLVRRSTTLTSDVPPSAMRDDLGAALGSHTNLDSAVRDWTQASRMAQKYCFNAGFVAGNFTGDTNLSTGEDGVSCYGDAVKIMSSNYEDMTLFDWPFQSLLTGADGGVNPPYAAVSGVNWARAGRVAQDFCARIPGYAGGWFLGDEDVNTNAIDDPGDRRFVCFRSANAAVMNIPMGSPSTPNTVEHDYWCSVQPGPGILETTTACSQSLPAACDCQDVNVMPWALANRVADHLCVGLGQGWAGGRFTGNQDTVSKQLLCFK